MTALSHRYDFVFLFDVTNGNPNGDPDAGNLPRLDPETEPGPRHRRLPQAQDSQLRRNRQRRRHRLRDLCPGGRDPQPAASQGLYRDPARRQESFTDKTLNPKDDDEADRLRDFMCDNFFDIRTFGAVMSTGVNCGQVRGPIQFSFARPSSRSCRSKSPLREWPRPTRPKRPSWSRAATTSGRRTAPWAASISCPTASIARMGSFPPSSPNEPASPRTTFRSFGIRSETCSSTTDRRRAARWRLANSSPSNTPARSATRRRTISSTAFASTGSAAGTSTPSATSGLTTCRRRGASPIIVSTIDRDGLPDGVTIHEFLAAGADRES